MAGLGIAQATGVVTTPMMGSGSMHGGNGFGMMQGDRDGSGMMGKRGRMHGGDGFGMMHGGDGFGMMQGERGRGRGYGDAQQTQMTDETIVLNVIDALQQEQALATALVVSNPALQSIADARTQEIAALTSLATAWYPDATIPTAVAASGTLADLQLLMTENTSHLQRMTAKLTFEHEELSTWVTNALQSRAQEMPLLYGESS
jgi:hypothetical protein